jgi:iron complex outermembrane receptor protein
MWYNKGFAARTGAGRLRTCLVMSSGLIGLALGVSPAAGQGIPQSDHASASVGAPAQSRSPGEVEEVIVTAQRREERLQDVPIAISVITASAARARGINNTADLAQSVPGLMMTKTASESTPTLRGVGSNLIAAGDENTVSTYVNGILQISPNSSIFSIANVERIEVLKGPQGTLFGRNSLGGVINVVTRTPSQAPHLDASVSYGNFDSTEERLYATAGLTSTIAADLAVYAQNQGSGWGHNVFTGADVYKSRDLDIRSSILFTPTDKTKITVAGEYRNFADNSSCGTLSKGDIALDGKTHYFGLYNIDTNSPCGVSGQSYQGDVTVRQDVGFADLVSLTGYSHVFSDRPTDPDGTPQPYFNGLETDQLDEGWTQEFQLQSKSSSPLSWIAGAYYLNVTSGYLPKGIIGTGSSVGGSYLLRGDEVATSYAGFAQATYEFAPATRLTLGGRYTYDTRSLDAKFSLPNLGISEAGDGSISYSNFSYKVTLDHKFARDTLVYATYSTGYKAGLYNLPSPTDPPVRPESLAAYELGFKTTIFDRKLQIDGSMFYYDYKDIQQSVFTNLVGTELINAAKGDVKGADLEITYSPNRAFNLSVGASYSKTRFDSFSKAPFFYPNGSARCLAAGNPNTVGGQCTVSGDATGNSFVKAPPLQVTAGGEYTLQLPIGEATFAVNYSYSSPFFWDVANQMREPARNLVNSTVTYSPNKSLDLQLWVENLLDDEYTNFGLPGTFGNTRVPGAPRTFGVRVGVKF